MSTSLYCSVALAASRIAVTRSSIGAAITPSRLHRRCCFSTHSAAFSSSAPAVTTTLNATPPTPTTTPVTTTASISSPTVPTPSPRLRPAVTSAQIRAQRPRASSKAASAGNPDSALDTEKCGPEQVAPEMVSVVNEKTGERMGPRGLEPTRFGDWEAKGRCWDF